MPSPAAGRVLRVLQQSETIAIAGAPLIEIGDPHQIEIAAEFLSQDAVRMQAGAAAQIENWGGDPPIPALVFRIEPYARTKISALGVEEQRVNVILHLRDPESAPPLGHGFRVDARVILSEAHDVIRVPTDALVRDRDGWVPADVAAYRAFWDDAVANTLEYNDVVRDVLGASDTTPPPPPWASRLPPALWRTLWRPVGRTSRWLTLAALPPLYRARIPGVRWTDADEQRLRRLGSVLRTTAGLSRALRSRGSA